MPNVNNEDQAKLGAFVPDLMLKGVVKDEKLSLFPGPRKHRVNKKFVIAWVKYDVVHVIGFIDKIHTT